MLKRFQSLRVDTVGSVHRGLTRKADICAKVLMEGRRLSQTGRFGAPLSQLVARACELLDDMDEILIVLDPERNGAAFAMAAKLHRELEHIQATIADHRRQGAAKSIAAKQR